MPGPRSEPYFERLDIRVDLPGIEQPLPVGHECISSHEALHEDIYFSLARDLPAPFGPRAGRPPAAAGADRARRARQRRRAPVAHRLAASSVGRTESAGDDGPSRPTPLEQLDTAPDAGRVASETGAAARPPLRRVEPPGPRRARRVPARLRAPPCSSAAASTPTKPRAWWAHCARPGPCRSKPTRTSPCCRSKTRRLCACSASCAAQHPHHMHHAARYSALGDDIEYREQPPLYERGCARAGAGPVGRAVARQPARLSGPRVDPAAVRLPAARLRAVDHPQGLLPDPAPSPRLAGAKARALVEQVSASLAQVAGPGRLQRAPTGAVRASCRGAAVRSDPRHRLRRFARSTGRARR